MKYFVIVTPDAESDLRQIYRYIRKYAPLAARKWVKGVRRAISRADSSGSEGRHV